MISNRSFVIFVMIIILVESVPIQINPLIDKIMKNKINIKETSAQTHDNTNELINIDNSKIFTDMNMNPNELKRKRRNIHFNNHLKQRHKRALSTYELFNTDPLYELLMESQSFVRPPRTLTPTYWYPSLYNRDIRSTSLYKPLELNSIENDDSEEYQTPFFINDDDDDSDENDYEYNRYPILFDSIDIPYENLQLQQEYNTDNLPIDDEELYSPYGPLEAYLK